MTDTSDKSETGIGSAPFKEGFQAGWEGKDLDANPYDADKPEWLSWREGWFDGQDDEELSDD